MTRPPREFEPLDVEEIRRLRGYPLEHLMRAPGRIPSKSGVYIWRYWPTLRDLSEDGFNQMLAEWQKNQPQFEETVANNRIRVSVVRTPFGGGKPGQSILGFDASNEKAKGLLAQFTNNLGGRQILAYTLECIFSATPPLYIGKAEDLRARLTDHFERRSSHVLKDIDNSKIPYSDIYISYFLDPSESSADQPITTALEEIIQRITNPPFTNRYG